jgi:hypothetical protein
LDFSTRCAQAGVIKCVGFDDAADFSTGSGGTNGAYSFNSGIMPASGTADYTRAARDTSVKASGSSSLKFTIPSNSGSDTSGSYFTNFSKDLSVQFDGGQEFFVQWRQRFSPEFISTKYLGGGGFKQIIVGTGDQPGTTFSSCSSLELPIFNYGQNGFPVMYNSCSGASSHGPYDLFEEPFGAYDFKFQNGRPSPGCLYSQKSSSYFSPTGNCFGYVANEWMTFQMQVTLGPRVGDAFQGSYVTLWGAREGKASELLIKWGPYNLTAGLPSANERYGKVWLLPYNTGKDSSQAHPTAYTWYDELIISTKKIADAP